MCRLRRVRLVIRTTRKLPIRRLRRSKKSLSRTKRPAPAFIVTPQTWARRNRRRAMMRRRREVELQNRVGTPVRSRFRNICRPLRGLTNIFLYEIPGLTPGAIFCRHLRWLVAQLTPPCVIFRAGLLFLIFLIPIGLVRAQGNDSDYSKFLHTSSKHA